MMLWTLLDKSGIDWLGFIPTFIREDDEREAAAQFNERYVWGGWMPFKGFTATASGALKYPGDPLMRPVAYAKLRHELIRVYPHAWVAIFQEDGRFEVCRMDLRPIWPSCSLQE